jgi:hydroxymethylbilane synthase
VAQAGQVAETLGPAAELVEVDADLPPEAGDKERFTRGVERLLLDGQAEAAVHSAKDLPGEMTAGLSIAAVPARVDPRDAWIGPGGSVAEIPEGARVGTASLRRRAQLKALRPDLEMVELRGNVDTRLRKLEAGEADGLVLAMAGLLRLGRSDLVAFAFDASEMIPAAGQGCLVVQTRSGREGEVEGISDADSMIRLLAERAAVVGLGADCSSPVGVHARLEGDWLTIDGFAGRSDGSVWLRDRVEGDRSRPEALGRELADRMLRAGAAEAMAGSTLSG